MDRLHASAVESEGASRKRMMTDLTNGTPDRARCAQLEYAMKGKIPLSSIITPTPQYAEQRKRRTSRSTRATGRWISDLAHRYFAMHCLCAISYQPSLHAQPEAYVGNLDEMDFDSGMGLVRHILHPQRSYQ